MFGSEVEGRVRLHQRRVQPIILVVAEDGVSPQLVDWQLFLQKADNLKLRQISTVTHIYTETKREAVQYLFFLFGNNINK